MIEGRNARAADERMTCAPGSSLAAEPGRGRPEPGLNFVAIVAFAVLSLLLLNLLAAIIVGLVHWAIRQPTPLFALLLLFVMFEVFFFGATYAILRGVGVDAPWLPLLGANVVAVLAMGWYLRYKHRLIGRWLARVPAHTGAGHGPGLSRRGHRVVDQLPLHPALWGGAPPRSRRSLRAHDRARVTAASRAPAPPLPVPQPGAPPRPRFPRRD